MLRAQFVLAAAALASLTSATASAGAGAAPPLFGASYRKDRWLADYIEFGKPLPLSGGRIHIVGLAAASGLPGAFTLNGSLVNVSVGQPDINLL